MQAASPAVTSIADYRSYNVGETVRVRLQGATAFSVAIRYSGKKTPILSGVAMSGSECSNIWKIPGKARTGRYEVMSREGKHEQGNIKDFSSYRMKSYMRICQILDWPDHEGWMRERINGPVRCCRMLDSCRSW